MPIIFSSRNGRVPGRQYYAEREDNDNVTRAGQRAFETVPVADRPELRLAYRKAAS